VFDLIPVPLYCERGASAALMAEPFNAISNIAYLAVAWRAWQCLRRETTKFDANQVLLIALVGIIGVGSAAFHLLGTRAAWFADVVPIGVFMLVYFSYVLRRILLFSRAESATIGLLFCAALLLASRITCTPALLPITAAARMPCLNGSLSYIPAVFGLIIAAAMSRARAPAAARPLGIAAVLMAAALMARTFDLELCTLSTYLDVRLGTHALWHILTAIALAWLLAAARSVPRAQLTAPPR
jgi:Ceramidase